MKKEYDFSKAEQGKFYRPIEKLEVPVYLDNGIKAFFGKKAAAKRQGLKNSKCCSTQRDGDAERNRGIIPALESTHHAPLSYSPILFVLLPVLTWKFLLKFRFETQMIGMIIWIIFGFI